MTVRVTFDDGTVVDEEWDGRSRWARFRYEGMAEVVEVAVDPEHVLVLDTDYTNNSWTAEPQARFAARKWAAKWMIWVQSLLEFFSFMS